MSKQPPLSVIIPVLDEVPTLLELHKRLRDELPGETEIIYVDDASRDGSDQVLRKIAAGDPGVRALRLRRHLGKSHALAAGFARARGSIIATLDADLQEEPREIKRLLEILEQDGYDLVGAWRRIRRDPPMRVLASRIFNFLASLLGGTKLRDINCGLKVMRREVVEEIPLAPGFHRFIPLLAYWKGFRIKEREIDHRPRQHGRSRYGGERILHGLVDLAVIMFLTRSEQRPSRFFIASGALSFLAGLVISAYMVYLRFFGGGIYPQYPLMALGILLLIFGIQIVTLGFFGELIAYHYRSYRSSAPAVRDLSQKEKKEEDSS